MNKKISTGVGIAIILIIAASVVGSILWMNKNMKETLLAGISQQSKVPLNNQPVANEENNKEKACMGSGGSISASNCCKTAGDFPNSCLIGACGCAPANSHQVKTCECGAGKCFDGNSCVSTSRLPGNEDPGTGDSRKNGGGQCTIEAKMCPDGTFVGRMGPNCEFAPCPKAK